MPNGVNEDTLHLDHSRERARMRTWNGVPEQGSGRNMVDSPPATNKQRNDLPWYTQYNSWRLVTICLWNYVREDPAVSCRWTGWVREITDWSSRLQDIYRLFYRNLQNTPQMNESKTEKCQHVNRLDLVTLGSWPTVPENFPGTVVEYLSRKRTSAFSFSTSRRLQAEVLRRYHVLCTTQPLPKWQQKRKPTELSRVSLIKKSHHIIQIHNSVLWDWHCST